MTTLLTDLNPQEKAVLELGPNFALAPTVGDRLLSEVNAELAACAYRLRWQQSSLERDTVPTRLQVWRQDKIPTNRKFINPPPPASTEMEENLRQLQKKIHVQLEHTKIQFNLSHQEAAGLKSLKSRLQDIHISVSDKGGEFVVTDRDLQQELTQNHLDTNSGVYEAIHPTRKCKGEWVEVRRPTQTTYQNQISWYTSHLEKECNHLWGDICVSRGFGDQMYKALKSTNTRLPCMYVLVKTHKFDADSLCSPEDILEKGKVRPIVSCVGSPSEKLAALVTQILSPLLNLIPSHLSNIHTHLKQLAELPPEQLKGKHFCSADISALYTNLVIDDCVKDVIDFAAENRELLNLRELHLCDVHQILELVLTNAYFTYCGRVYKQLVGLFMGCRPSPIAAVIRVYKFERSTIYTDVKFISLSLYGRYIDDAWTLSHDREAAVSLFNTIAQQDPRKLLKWEVDFPKDGDFTPFLGTEIRITGDKLESKFYRKGTRKDITLHFRSHHPLETKVQTVRNFYRTAEISSSNSELLQQSLAITDRLLLANGYEHPRQFGEQKTRGRSKKCSDNVMLKLPYVSETVSSEIRKFITARALPIDLVVTPGTCLRDMLCSSRPHDNLECLAKNCNICERLEKGSCTTMSPVYQITCLLCGGIYVGESCRSVHDRLSEHSRNAKNPNAPSYIDTPLAIHYTSRHKNTPPELSFKILTTERNILKRKILEAMYIQKLRPELNNKEECSELTRYLI